MRVCGAIDEAWVSAASRLSYVVLFVATLSVVIAAEPKTPRDPSIGAAAVMDLQLSGIGMLRFGQRLEWQLVSQPPARLEAREGVRLGAVSIRSVSGNVRHVLPEPPGFSHTETGNSCAVSRIGIHAVIRCSRDYVFNTQTGAVPAVISPQFNDRSESAVPWLLSMPLPWWRLAGYEISGSSLVFLEYGYVNYGQAVESTHIQRGPALLDLATGRIAIARAGDSAEGVAYDASMAGEDEPVAQFPLRFLGDRIINGHRVVTVMTLFDRCVAARCRGDSEPGFRRELPLTYVFD